MKATRGAPLRQPAGTSERNACLFSASISAATMAHTSSLALCIKDATHGRKRESHDGRRKKKGTGNNFHRNHYWIKRELSGVARRLSSDRLRRERERCRDGPEREMERNWITWVTFFLSSSNVIGGGSSSRMDPERTRKRGGGGGGDVMQMRIAAAANGRTDGRTDGG